jgi:Fe-S-cluster containining protein
MAPNPRRLDARLQELYDQLPTIACRGLCSDSCGPAPASIRERDRMERASGQRFTCGVGATCSMLDEHRRCSVYELRPLVCRMWGVMESMRCPYGCKPDGEYVSDIEGFRLVAESLAIGGDPGADDRFYREAFDRMVETLGAEELARYARWAGRKMLPRPSVDARQDAGIPKSVIER